MTKNYYLLVFLRSLFSNLPKESAMNIKQEMAGTKQETALRRALHHFTKAKRKANRRYKKEIVKGNDRVSAEIRHLMRVAEAGEELSLAVRRIL